MENPAGIFITTGFICYKPVSRVLFAVLQQHIYHLSRLYVAAQLHQPTHPKVITCEQHALLPDLGPIWSFNTRGLPTSDIATGSRGLLHRVFTITSTNTSFVGATYFLWHFLSFFSIKEMKSFPLGSELLCVARTFLCLNF